MTVVKQVFDTISISRHGHLTTGLLVIVTGGAVQVPGHEVGAGVSWLGCLSSIFISGAPGIV